MRTRCPRRRSRSRLTFLVICAFLAAVLFIGNYELDLSTPAKDPFLFSISTTIAARNEHFEDIRHDDAISNAKFSLKPLLKGLDTVLVSVQPSSYPVMDPQDVHMRFRTEQFDAVINKEGKLRYNRLLPLKHGGKHIQTSPKFPHKPLYALIPTVTRRLNTSYIERTITSLHLKNPDSSNDYVILIFMNDVNLTVEKMSPSLQNAICDIVARFPDKVAAGLIRFIIPSARYYPNFNTVFNFTMISDIAQSDGEDRFAWRSKQALDYAFMFSFAAREIAADYMTTHGRVDQAAIGNTLVLLLEDDVAANMNWAARIANTAPKAFLEQRQYGRQYFWVEFASFGAVGKVFEQRTLPFFSLNFQLYYQYEPVDWIMGHVLELVVCHYNDKDKCGKKVRKLFHVFKPPLFSHIAKISSAPKKANNSVNEKDWARKTKANTKTRSLTTSKVI